MREGYKLTELGEIPTEWNIFKLKDIGNFKNGINKSKEDFGKGYPFVNLMNVFGISVIKPNGLSLVDINEKEKKDYNLLKGDVLFIRSSVKPSGVGLTSLVAEDISDTVFSGFLIRFRDNGTLITDFKRYCFYELGFRRRLLNLSSVSANTNINQNSLEGLLIPVPTHPEQQKIATILSTVDEKIEVIEEQIKETETLKKGLMQQLLTKGIGHTKFKDSPLGEIPESWEVGTLESEIELTNGFPFESAKFNIEGKGVRLLRGMNITIGRLRWEEKIDRYWDETIEGLKKYSVKEGDIVISMDGSLVGRNYAMVKESDLPLLLVQRVALIRTNKNLSSDYLFHIIGTSLFKDYVDAVKTSSGIPHISAKNILEFKIPIPPIEEQFKIALVWNLIELKYEVLKGKSQEYKILKKGLMQQLLTGKMRVKI